MILKVDRRNTISLPRKTNASYVGGMPARIDSASAMVTTCTDNNNVVIGLFYNDSSKETETGTAYKFVSGQTVAAQTNATILELPTTVTLAPSPNGETPWAGTGWTAGDKVYIHDSTYVGKWTRVETGTWSWGQVISVVSSGGTVSELTIQFFRQGNL